MKLALLGAANSSNTHSWVESLRREGHQVEVLTFHSAAMAGTEVHDLAARGFPFRAGYLLGVRRARRLLRRLAPELVIGYYLTSYGLVAALSWRGPLVLTAAGSDILGRRSGSLLTRRTLRFLAGRGDLFVAWAGHMADRLREMGVPGEKILVIHRGIDESVFRPEGERIVGGWPHTVISTRGLKTVYDLETLLRAVGHLAERGTELGMSLLGDGPLRESLRDLALRLGLRDRVDFLGQKPPGEIAGRLRGAEVYLGASLWDGAPSSLFEAMATGCFPVVSDIPANREWIRDGWNGYLVPPRDVAAYASALARALESPELREMAARRNIEIVRERLDRQRNISLMTERFRSLLP